MAEDIKDLQIDTEMTAGEILRMARTTGRRKREISTISKQLCIREDFLEALEQGNYAVLPEKVYILGFARNYAMELGVDPDMIVAKIKKELGLIPLVQEAVEKFEAPKPAPVPKPVAPKPVPKEPVVENVKEEKSSGSSAFSKFFGKYWKWMLGGLVLLAVVAAVVVVLIFEPWKNNSEIDALPQDFEPEVTYQQPVRERHGVENRQEAEIILQATRESWLRIEDARGKTLFSVIMFPGDIYYVPAGGKVKATFGDAGGIDVWVRGALIPKLGEDHVQKEGILLDPDALISGPEEPSKEAPKGNGKGNGKKA